MRLMIRWSIVLILILSILSLTACSLSEVIFKMLEKSNSSDLEENSRTDMLNESNNEEKADARLEEIIKAINDEDRESLKLIFSEHALTEAEDIDGRIDYLFNFVEGNIESWETIVHGATSEAINNGSKVKSSMSWYYADTPNQKYLIFFVEYIDDTGNPSNIGVYMLQVIKAEDKDTQFEGFGPNTRCAGIYMP